MFWITSNFGKIKRKKMCLFFAKWVKIYAK